MLLRHKHINIRQSPQTTIIISYSINHLTMFRLGFRQIAVSRVAVSQPIRPLTYSLTARKSVVDLAKDILEKANKKTGEFLAGTMESAEHAGNIKHVAEEANLKTGKVLADGMQKAEDVAHDVKEKVTHTKVDADTLAEKAKEGAQKVNLKTGEVLSDGMEKAENLNETVKLKAGDFKQDAESLKRKASYNAEEMKDDAANMAEEATSNVKEAGKDLHDKTDGFTEKSRERKRVEENAKGYKDLQDRGAHLESEQGRPDDGV